MDKVKTPDELQDNNSQNVAELFELLLTTKRDAFIFPKDGNGSKKGNDGSINNPINLEDPTIDWVFDKIDEEMSTEKTNKKSHGKTPLAKGKPKDDENSNKKSYGKKPLAKCKCKDNAKSESSKEKNNADSKTDEEVEG